MKLSESKMPYQDVSYDDLFIYALYVISENKKRIEWQDIVIAAFPAISKEIWSSAL